MYRVFPEMFCVIIRWVPSVSSPLSSQHHSPPSLVHSHPHRNYSCQGRSLMCLWWFYCGWRNGDPGGSWPAVKPVAFSSFIFFYFWYSFSSIPDGWGIFGLWKLEAVCDNLQRMSGQEIWCKFHWKKNLLPKGSPLQVSSDMKIQLSPQYWKVYCKQRVVSTHLLLMGSPPWSKHRMWLPGGPVSSEAALRLNLARSLSGAV